MYKCLNKKSNEYVALKKVDTLEDKVCQDGFPITAIREIKILKTLKHKNIVELKEIVLSRPSL